MEPKLPTRGATLPPRRALTMSAAASVADRPAKFEVGRSHQAQKVGPLTGLAVEAAAAASGEKSESPSQAALTRPAPLVTLLLAAAFCLRRSPRTQG